jgi:dolichol-phosphate mannosyltransferase
MDLTVIVPCYNEEENVQVLRDGFLPVIYALAQTRSVEVVFVDDGSRDTTWEALNNTLGDCNEPNVTIRIERHLTNRGLGAAIRTGFSVARGEIVVTTDSDGTYPFAEIPTLISYLKPGVDLVTASPYHPQGGVGGVSAYRLILSKGSSTIYRFLVNWNIHTYTSLFRAYRHSMIEQVPFQSDGFLAGTELLVNAILKGYQAVEYPTVLYARVHGWSKAKIARTIVAHLRFQFQLLLRRMKLISYGHSRDTVNV